MRVRLIYEARCPGCGAEESFTDEREAEMWEYDHSIGHGIPVWA